MATFLLVVRYTLLYNAPALLQVAFTVAGLFFAVNSFYVGQSIAGGLIEAELTPQSTR